MKTQRAEKGTGAVEQETVIEAAPATTALAPRNVNDALVLAERLAQSSLLPTALRNKPGDVLVVLMKGQELGLAPMQAISSIHVIAGKAVCEAALMVGLCVSHPRICAYFTLIESTADRAVYETQRIGAPEPVRLTYTLAEAKQAGLTGKDNWKNHTAAMLRARASGALARAIYPDLVAGIYTPDEAEEFREPAQTIQMPRRLEPPAAAPQAAPPAAAPASDEPPQEEERSAVESPAYHGKVKAITEKSGEKKNGDPWTLYTIEMADGERFGTFSKSMRDIAEDFRQSGDEMGILWEATARGNKNIVEIIPF